MGGRDYAFTGDAQGNVKKLHAIRVGPAPKFEPIPGTEFTLDADLVLLAMGFTGPVKQGLVEELGLKLDARGNVRDEQIIRLDSGRLRGGRRAARAVAGGVGDRGGAQGGGGRGSIPTRDKAVC